jgi:lysyl-tRNA synthetase class II
MKSALVKTKPCTTMCTKNYLDIGDIIGIEGELFTTQVGEKTVMVKHFSLVEQSSLKPLPLPKVDDGRKSTYDAFNDPELRYRQRYVDLVVNPQVKGHLHQANKDHQQYSGSSITKEGIWKWKRQFCSLSPVVRQQVHS